MKRRDFLKSVSALVATHLLARPVFALSKRQTWIERAQPLMGSITTVALVCSDEEKGHQRITQCFEEMRRVVALISDWEDNSLTTSLNSKRRMEGIRPGDPIVSLITAAEYVRNHSLGSFNSATLGLTKLWRNAHDRGMPPAVGEIKEELEKVSGTKTQYSSSSLTVLGHGGLEFGGIGKGFVADCGVEFLRRNGVEHARIAASGDIRFLGPGPWTVDIEHPRKENEMLGTTIVRGDMAVSTSGDYRSSWTAKGERYHHLLDLKTGYPAKFNQSATVIAKTGALADGLSSAMFLMDGERGKALANLVLQLGAIIVDRKGVVQKSAGTELT